MSALIAEYEAIVLGQYVSWILKNQMIMLFGAILMYLLENFDFVEKWRKWVPFYVCVSTI